MGIVIDRTDGLASSSAMKGPVRCATTTNILLSGLQVIDGISVQEDDRVLVKDQTDARANGIYVVSIGLWRRSADFNNNRDIREGTMLIVTDGVLNAGQWYVASENPINIGTTLLSFKRVLTFGLAPGQINGGVVFETKAQMDANLNYADKQMAWVIRDPVVGNNGTYYKSGASGTGSWVRIGDLPYSFIPATNNGTGTANAIQATTEIPIPLVDRAVLIALPIVATTTGSATVSFNSDTPLPIVDFAGVDLASGELEAGQIVCGYKYQGQFRLLTGRRGWSPLLRVVADGARRVLQLYDWAGGHGPKPNVYGYLGTSGIVSDINQATDIRGPEGPNGPGTGDMLKDDYDPRHIEGDAFPYRTKAEVEAATIPVSVDFIRLVGYSEVGDGGGGLYKRVPSEPSHAGKIQSADGAWWELAEEIVNPIMFGAIGDGVTDDTASVQNCFDYCLAKKKEWVIPSPDFLVSEVIAYTGGEFLGRLVGTNDPALSAVFEIAADPADITPLTAAFVNTLTIQRGLDRDAALAPYYGHVVWLENYGDEVPIIRVGGGLRWMEAVIVHDPDGSIYPPYSQAKTATWTDQYTAAGATLIREKVTIKNPKVAILNSGAGGREAIIRCTRPNTVLENGDARSESTLEVLQAFVTARSALVTYKDCYVQGLRENATNYGWNHSSSCVIDQDNCSEIFCRRGQDAHGGKHITIRGGSYPDGIGGHWVHGLYASGGAFISSDPPNAAPIHAAGSDVSVDGCRIIVRQDQFNVLNVRSDIFEMRGVMRLVDCDIDLLCTDNLTTRRQLVNIDTTAGNFDWGRPINMPGRIDVRGNFVRQLGASFNEQVRIVNFLSSNPKPPSGIVAAPNIDVGENTFGLAAGDMFGTSPRLSIVLSKDTGWNAGGIYKVAVSDLPALQIYTFCASGHSNIAGIRGDFDVKRIGTLQWQANYGAFRYADLQSDAMTVSMGSGRPASGNTTPVGDERERFTAELYGEVVWNPPQILDGAMASTTMTVNGVKAGDGCVISISTMTEPGWFVYGQGTADNTVTVSAFNKTGASLDKGSSLVRAWVKRAGLAS